jgi:hypothetical protein
LAIPLDVLPHVSVRGARKLDRNVGAAALMPSESSAYPTAHAATMRRDPRDGLLWSVQLCSRAGNLARVSVFILWHPGESDPYEGPLLLGVYSTRQRAEARVAEAKGKPGFRDRPDDFEISEYRLDQDRWSEGFTTYEYPIEHDGQAQ